MKEKIKAFLAVEAIILGSVIFLLMVGGAFAYTCCNNADCSDGALIWYTHDDIDRAGGITYDICNSTNFLTPATNMAENGVTTGTTSPLWNETYDYDGTDDYTWNATTTESHFTGNDNFSMNAWVNFTNNHAATAIIVVEQDANAFGNIMIGITADEFARCFIGDTDGDSISVDDNVPLNNGALHMITCVYWAANHTLQTFVNGTFENSAQDNNIDANLFSGDSRFSTGARWNQGTMSWVNEFTGSIEEASIWNWTLIQENTSALYANNTITQGPGAPPGAGCTIALGTPADNDHDDDSTPSFNQSNLICYVNMPTRCYVTMNGVQSGDNSTTLVNGSGFNITANSSKADASYDWNITCIRGATTNTSANRTLVIDTTTPSLVITTPANNSSYQYSTSNNLNVICTDTNVYNLSCAIMNSTGQQAIYTNSTPVGVTLTLVNEFTSSLNVDSSLWAECNCSDSHTQRKWKADKVTAVEGLLEIEKGSYELITSFDWGETPTYKELHDRIKWSVPAYVNEQGDIKVKFHLTCNSPIDIITGSEYAGHIVCGQMWADFQDLVDTGFDVMVVRENANTVEVEIEKDLNLPPGTEVLLDPNVGGLNWNASSANFSIIPLSAELTFWEATLGLPTYGTTRDFRVLYSANATASGGFGDNQTYNAETVNFFRNIFNNTGKASNGLQPPMATGAYNDDYFVTSSPYAWQSGESVSLEFNIRSYTDNTDSTFCTARYLGQSFAPTDQLYYTAPYAYWNRYRGTHNATHDIYSLMRLDVDGGNCAYNTVITYYVTENYRYRGFYEYDGSYWVLRSQYTNATCQGNPYASDCHALVELDTTTLQPTNIHNIEMGMNWTIGQAWIWFDESVASWFIGIITLKGTPNAFYPNIYHYDDTYSIVSNATLLSADSNNDEGNGYDFFQFIPTLDITKTRIRALMTNTTARADNCYLDEWSGFNFSSANKIPSATCLFTYDTLTNTTMSEAGNYYYLPIIENKSDHLDEYAVVHCSHPNYEDKTANLLVKTHNWLTPVKISDDTVFTAMGTYADITPFDGQENANQTEFAAVSGTECVKFQLEGNSINAGVETINLYIFEYVWSGTIDGTHNITLYLRDELGNRPGTQLGSCTLLVPATDASNEWYNCTTTSSEDMALGADYYVCTNTSKLGANGNPPVTGTSYYYNTIVSWTTLSVELGLAATTEWGTSEDYTEATGYYTYGTVVDCADREALDNVRINITQFNDTESFQFSTETNSTGYFLVPNLQPHLQAHITYTLAEYESITETFTINDDYPSPDLSTCLHYGVGQPINVHTRWFLSNNVTDQYDQILTTTQINPNETYMKDTLLLAIGIVAEDVTRGEWWEGINFSRSTVSTTCSYSTTPTSYRILDDGEGYYTFEAFISGTWTENLYAYCEDGDYFQINYVARGVYALTRLDFEGYQMRVTNAQTLVPTATGYSWARAQGDFFHRRKEQKHLEVTEDYHSLACNIRLEHANTTNFTSWVTANITENQAIANFTTLAATPSIMYIHFNCTAYGFDDFDERVQVNPGTDVFMVADCFITDTDGDTLEWHKVNDVIQHKCLFRTYNNISLQTITVRSDNEQYNHQQVFSYTYDSGNVWYFTAPMQADVMPQGEHQWDVQLSDLPTGLATPVVTYFQFVKVYWVPPRKVSPDYCNGENCPKNLYKGGNYYCKLVTEFETHYTNIIMGVKLNASDTLITVPHTDSFDENSNIHTTSINIENIGETGQYGILSDTDIRCYAQFYINDDHLTYGLQANNLLTTYTDEYMSDPAGLQGFWSELLSQPEPLKYATNRIMSVPEWAFNKLGVTNDSGAVNVLIVLLYLIAIALVIALSINIYKG